MLKLRTRDDSDDGERAIEIGRKRGIKKREKWLEMESKSDKDKWI